jgi:chromosome segregation ATPase
MKKLLFIIILNSLLVPSYLFSQTEDEKRAIMAAANKIKSDSTRLESRSTRIAEQKKQLDFLTDAIEKAYRTIEVMDTLDTIRQGQIKRETEARKKAETERDEANENAAKQEKAKKNWRNTSIGLFVVVAIETLILVL